MSSSEENGRDRMAAIEAKRRSIGDEARAPAIARQHQLGKLSARQRIAHLVDPQSFREVGGLVEPAPASSDDEVVEAPADGIVTGGARIDGRPVSLCAFDFTVVGGSNGKTGGLKMQRMMTQALDNGLPFVMLFDGGGHRIQEGLDSRHFATGSLSFQIQAHLSGWVPMTAAILGPGFAGPSNYAALADFVVMVRGTSTMGIAGPALVKAAIGEDLDKEALGGAEVQADRYGIADLAVDNDAAALDAIRRFLSYLPSNAGLAPPVLPCDDPAERREESLLDIVPDNPRRAYDVRRVIAGVMDRDSVFELKPSYARNIVTSLARLDGRPVGIIANQAQQLGGALDSPACEKAAHFVSLCDAYGLPLVYLVDMPGFLVGSAAERSGLARRSGRLLYELGHATVPRFSVVLRKGYGLGYIAMCGGRSFDADLSVAWPTAEICAMSVEGAVDVAYRKEIRGAADPEAKRIELIDRFKRRLGALRAAEGFGIDDIIDPRHTRPVLIEALRRAAPRRQRNLAPPKRHGISPI
jgi:propionyl-CoA carboxylase beta chain